MRKRKNRLKLCLTLLTFLILINTVLPVFASDDITNVEEPAQETTSELSSEDSIQSEEQESEPIIQVEESRESDVPETETSTILETSASQSDLCYIKAFEISEVEDGTAPFDDNNDPGNDSAIDNGIVRSFDNLFYTLKYTTAIKNNDGIKQNNEEVLSLVPIKVYRNIKDVNDTSDETIVVNGVTYYPAYDAYGNKINDKNISSDSNGKWEINNLKEGDYIVISEVEKKYYVTDYHAGEDRKTNSDAQEDNNLIFVANINIPNPNNMTEQDFINEYNNIGLVIKTFLEINKISSLDGKALEGATLSIYNAADYLPNGTIKENAVPVIEWVSSSKVKVLENLLVAGKGYVLIEKRCSYIP